MRSEYPVDREAITRAPTHPGVFFAEEHSACAGTGQRRRDSGVARRQQADAAPHDERLDGHQSGPRSAFGQALRQRLRIVAQHAGALRRLGSPTTPRQKAREDSNFGVTRAS